MSPTVTLTTDFGTRDPYVAIMKGVILARAPGTQIVDLSHEIAPHDVMEAALFVAAALPAFPPDAVHVAVIDPGVGTERRPLAMRVGPHLLVCPDNGISTFLDRRIGVTEARVIESPRFTLPSVSATFHGRDVFAPAAAGLAAGGALADVGPPAAAPLRLDIPAAERDEQGGIRGRVIHVDRFGNALTNITREAIERALPGETAIECRVGPHAMRVARTYADAPLHRALALIGSSDLLEVAVNRGSAARRLDLRRGDDVRVAAAPDAPR